MLYDQLKKCFTQSREHWLSATSSMHSFCSHDKWHFFLLLVEYLVNQVCNQQFLSSSFG